MGSTSGLVRVGPHYRLDAVAGASDLLVVFPGLVAAAGEDGPRGLREPPGVSRLVYTNNQPEFWSGGVAAMLSIIPAMRDEIAGLAREAGAQRIRCFGTSFGGFSAILLGSLLGAGRIVAAGAQTTLNLRGSRAERFLRGQRIESPFADLRTVLGDHPPRDLHVLFGTRDHDDARHALRLASLPGVTAHAIGGAAHGLTGIGTMAAMLDATVADEGLGAWPGRLDSLTRPATAGALAEGFEAKTAGEPARAEDAYGRAAALAPDAALPLVRLGLLRLALRRPRDAVAALEAALALDPGEPRAAASLARAVAADQDAETRDGRRRPGHGGEADQGRPLARMMEAT